MTADQNVIQLQDIEPNTSPVLLSDNLDIGDQIISVASTAGFVDFDGQANIDKGYVKINSEIIFYDSVGTNQLGIGTRGVEGTIERTHAEQIKSTLAGPLVFAKSTIQKSLQNS